MWWCSDVITILYLRRIRIQYCGRLWIAYENLQQRRFFRKHTVRQINRSVFYLCIGISIVAGDKSIFYGARYLSTYSAGLNCLKCIHAVVPTHIIKLF